jgi:hypothetical protein
MRLSLQLLRDPEIVTKRLESDGWELEPGGVDTLFAWHSAVDGVPAARQRLLGVGLLTSAAVRIEFTATSSRR